MRVGLYGRVSTMHNQNPEMQLAELREHAFRRGWKVVGEYIDQGISGARERRPQLDRLWSDCRKRRVDGVLVYRYDRFARSLRQLVNALEEFRSLGIDFISLHEGVDTSTPNGRLVFGIFASIAEFERELIRGRVISGLAAAVARGVRLGRPRSVVDAAEIVRLRASGASWREVAERMGIGVGTAVRALQQALQIPQETTPSKLPTNG
jgi:DNA invertase Pin-like site-specific DNA recombinase